MIARGRVHNGVVLLDDGVRLPEGQEVAVLALGEALERPVPGLSEQEQRRLVGEAARASTLPSEGSQPHSILDIPPVSLGPVLRPPTADDDLLEEMLEGRS